jgi:hypothetical protein
MILEHIASSAECLDTEDALHANTHRVLWNQEILVPKTLGVGAAANYLLWKQRLGICTNVLLKIEVPIMYILSRPSLLLVILNQLNR